MTDARKRSGSNAYRNVQHVTPKHYTAASDAIKHPAPILDTNINPISEIFSYTGDATKFVLVMVGLPARGKSFIARKIRSYLSWLGIDVQWFNIGQYRRYCAPDTVGTSSSKYFSEDEVSKKRRELYALIALVELEKYLISDNGQVAILDGTNSTKYRRIMIRNFFNRKKYASNIKLVFIESICNNNKIIEQNILNVKLKSPDYVNVSPEQAVRDFKERIKHYEKRYITLDENDGSYIKLYDAGKKVVGYDVNGYLPSRILYFLMHLNLYKVFHFFTRHGESLYNTQGRIGGDSPLTSSGIRYSKTMSNFISLQPEFKNGSMQIWCSTLKRCVETAKPLNKNNNNILKWRALCEIEAGICDGMTYAEIEEKYPQIYKMRFQNKLTFRYPQGESYKDIIKRLEPVIFELERATKPVLVIAHQAVLRCLYGYFMDKSLDEIPHLKIDLHTVYKLIPTDYSTEIDKFTFGCVSSKPTTADFIPDKLLTGNAALCSYDLPVVNGAGLNQQQTQQLPIANKKRKSRTFSNGNYKQINKSNDDNDNDNDKDQDKNKNKNQPVAPAGNKNQNVLSNKNNTNK